MVRVIDATGCVLGRLASETAKLLLAGEEVAIVNCERAIVTGKRDQVMERFHFKRNVGTARKGPHYPRVPHLIVKRVVRGMLPYYQAKGREAHQRLRCYIGVPDELSGETAEVLEHAKPRTITPNVELVEVSRRLGAKV